MSENTTAAPQPNRRGRRKLAAVAAIVLLAGVLTAAAIYGLRGRFNHFACVQSGVLYRSSQPGAADWDMLVKECHIRTVIDLREIMPDTPWSRLQDQVCRDNGLRLVHIPMGTRDAPTDEQIKQLMDVLRDARNWPVLVHCEKGTARTGVMVGYYRIVGQGWDYADTFKDARIYGFNPANNPQYDAFLRATWEKCRPAASKP